MHCKQARKLLIHTMDCALPADETEAVRSHLSECAECRRFAEAMHTWQANPATHHRGRSGPDLTERVLANVRPLPPPWVFRQEHQSKNVPQMVAFLVGALGVTLAFLMLCLTFIVAVVGDTRTDGGTQRQLLVPEVWHDVQVWMNSIPHDGAHTAVTFVLSIAFLVLTISWFRTLSARVGRDRQ